MGTSWGWGVIILLTMKKVRKEVETISVTREPPLLSCLPSHKQTLYIPNILSTSQHIIGLQFLDP
jgi:hypothetical protein